MDTTSQAGKMFFYTLMNYAEWERSVIRDRTHSGRLRRAQEGRNPGMAAPYGYQKTDAGFEPVPHEAATVRRIFEQYRLGAGVAVIAEQFNAEGLRFRGGRRWHAGTVAYILSNPAYTGRLVWGARTRNPRHGKQAGEPLIIRRDQPLVETDGLFPPLVTPEEFDKAQAAKRQRNQVGRVSGPARSRSSDYLLTGLLRCGLCGAPMVGRHNNPNSPTGYYYGCITRRDKGRSVCPAASIPCHLLDEAVERKLRALHATEATRRRCVAAAREDLSRASLAAQAELAEIDRQWNRLAQRERRIGHDYADGKLTAEEYRHLRAGLAEEREALARSAGELRRSRLNRAGSPPIQDRAERLRLWEDLPIPRRKELLRQLVQQVRTTRQSGAIRCEVLWRAEAAAEPESETTTA